MVAEIRHQIVSPVLGSPQAVVLGSQSVQSPLTTWKYANLEVTFKDLSRVVSNLDNLLCNILNIFGHPLLRDLYDTQLYLTQIFLS